MHLQYAVTLLTGETKYMGFLEMIHLDLSKVRHIFLLDTTRGISTKLYGERYYVQGY